MLRVSTTAADTVLATSTHLRSLCLNALLNINDEDHLQPRNSALFRQAEQRPARGQLVSPCR